MQLIPKNATLIFAIAYLDRLSDVLDMLSAKDWCHIINAINPLLQGYSEICESLCIKITYVPKQKQNETQNSRDIR